MIRKCPFHPKFSENENETSIGIGSKGEEKKDRCEGEQLKLLPYDTEASVKTSALIKKILN